MPQMRHFFHYNPLKLGMDMLGKEPDGRPYFEAKELIVELTFWPDMNFETFGAFPFASS